MTVKQWNINSDLPLISVSMGVYNCENTLDEALASIIKQTYKNWEIIICDDSSTDLTVKVAQRYVSLAPEKIRLFQNNTNLGLNKTLNKCLEQANGDLIARMDGDDTCSKERLEEEVNYLLEHPELSIVSTDMSFFDEKGIWGQTNAKLFPQPKDFIKGTQFCHAGCMVWKDAYKAVNGYSEGKRLLRVEDYHLWIKMYEKGYRGGNIKQPLYQMRDDRNDKKKKKFHFRINEVYVKAFAVKHLHLPKIYYISCVVPIMIGLLPDNLYSFLHRKKQACIMQSTNKQ